MELLLYSAEHPKGVHDLREVIRKAAPRHGISVFKSLDSLKVRLLQPRRRLKIAILKPADKKELENLVPMRDLLLDLRVLVIVPDHEGSTAALAHRLRPRCIWYPEQDGEILGRVVGNMIRLYR